MSLELIDWLTIMELLIQNMVEVVVIVELRLGLDSMDCVVVEVGVSVEIQVRSVFGLKCFCSFSP